jgi:hypothetical protein
MGLTHMRADQRVLLKTAFPPADITQEAAQPERLFFACERDLLTLPQCKDDSRILLRNRFFYLLFFRADSGMIVPLRPRLGPVKDLA